MIGNIQFPSDSPSITQVGGTTLTNGSAPSYQWKSEVVWAWSSGPNVSARSATSSSGGVSTYYAMPSWQSNISMTASQGSTTMRNFPDVAANADNCYLYYNNGTTAGGWGGTSFAAPLWAGYTALINQQAAANGRPPVGFLNPALYSAGLGNKLHQSLPRCHQRQQYVEEQSQQILCGGRLRLVLRTWHDEWKQFDQCAGWGGSRALVSARSSQCEQIDPELEDGGRKILPTAIHLRLHDHQLDKFRASHQRFQRGRNRLRLPNQLAPLLSRVAASLAGSMRG